MQITSEMFVRHLIKRTLFSPAFKGCLLTYASISPVFLETLITSQLAEKFPRLDGATGPYVYPYESSLISFMWN